ncbi:hypothetical protein GQX74_003959 [Glossina fuscipes]|nr:hypothetical protein GQX74_003959 [Glossina fuscipes]
MVTIVTISGIYRFVIEFNELILQAHNDNDNDTDHIPHPCDTVSCPSLSDLSCPNDSEERPFLMPFTSSASSNSSVVINDELFAQCCLNQKCMCKTCHIPDCNEAGEVVVELSPESMDTPGNCCGKYECQLEPNCTEHQNTDSYWLTNCQRCKCFAGQNICHQICDENSRKSAICHSKNLNKFFEDGDTWKDGCSECECINGEPNCVITFCRSVGCPPHLQVTQNDSCCPICWPEGIPMPNGRLDYIDEEDGDEGNESDNHYDEDENIPMGAIGTDDYLDRNSNELLPDIVWNITNRPSKSDNFTTTVSTGSPSSTPTSDPCTKEETPAAYQLYPQVVELMRYNQQNDILYTIIALLSILVIVLAAWNIHLKSKQRSYRPVSNFDDNFNRMSSNIKKMNDYV